MFNEEYIAEKTEMVKRAVRMLDNGLETDDIGQVINGILTIEDALSSLHVGAKRAMKMAGTAETNYGLRDLGNLRKGD